MPHDTRPARYTASLLAAGGLLVTAALGAGCGGGPDPAGTPSPTATASPSAGTVAPSATTTYGPDVVHFDGVRDIRFGDSQRALTARHALAQELPDCGPRLVAVPKVSPIFVDDRLVVLWAEPPVHTPEGLGVGSPVDRVRSAYPAATALQAPAGAYRFDGLLVTRGDRAYLFLHDAATVKKLIVGYVQYAKLLFDQGYSAC